MFAGTYGGRLYRCTDGSGIVWEEVKPVGERDRNWRAITCSFLGDKVYAGIYDNNSGDTLGRIWRSEAYGADTTWTAENDEQPVSGAGENWTTLDCSYVGNVVLAACSYTALNQWGRIHRSDDKGVTWVEVQPRGNEDVNWMHARLTHDGNKELVCSDSAGVKGIGRVYALDAAGYDVTSDDMFLEILRAGFEFLEESVEKSSPVELYDLVFGSKHWHWTSADSNIRWRGNDYIAIPIERTKILLASAQELDILEVTIPATNEFAGMFVDIVPSRLADLTITRIHRYDDLADTSEGYVVIFRGAVQSVAFSRNNFEARLAVTPMSMNLAKAIPMWTYQSLCNHMLFDCRCGISENDPNFRADCVVSAATGNTLTVTGLAGPTAVAGWATAGFVQWGQEFRTILEHRAGGNLDLILPFYHDVLDESVIVHIGCDHTSETCRLKFDNILNYLGFEHVPTKNPFSVRTD
jgi:uncharacterized phage protein (TIGR02218 family)